MSIHVRVGPLDAVLARTPFTEVARDGDAIGVQELTRTLEMADAELGAWVRALLAAAARGT